MQEGCCERRWSSWRDRSTRGRCCNHEPPKNRALKTNRTPRTIFFLSAKSALLPTTPHSLLSTAAHPPTALASKRPLHFRPDSFLPPLISWPDNLSQALFFLTPAQQHCHPCGQANQTQHLHNKDTRHNQQHAGLQEKAAAAATTKPTYHGPKARTAREGKGEAGG